MVWLRLAGRALVIPRELSVVGSELMVSPVVETAALRKHATQHQLAPAAHGAALAAGSQVELRVNCTAPAAGWPTNGLLGIRTLVRACCSPDQSREWDYVE